MEVKVLGAGCPDCTQLRALVDEVVTEAGLELDVQTVAAAPALRSYGLCEAPAW